MQVERRDSRRTGGSIKLGIQNSIVACVYPPVHNTKQLDPTIKTQMTGAARVATVRYGIYALEITEAEKKAQYQSQVQGGFLITLCVAS